MLLSLAASPAAFAGDAAVTTSGKAAVAPLPDDRWTSARPDGHAPAGVMGDHVHHAGEWMLGYHYMWQHSEGLQRGDSNIGTNDVFRSPNPAGGYYTVAPLEMDMHMSMLELMYAPADWLTFMVMTGYTEMSMDMYGTPHHGGSHDMMAGEMMHREYFGHSTSGWGDTSLTAMATLFNANHQTAHIDLGLSFPTGSVDEKGHAGAYTHYGMQLGSGTYDLLPGVTYLGQSDRLSWGAQYSAVIRLEDENDSGFRFGDIHQVTAWTAYRICDWASVSGRIAYRTEGQVHGHYDGAHNHSSPPDLQSNYGGDSLDLGVGLNLWAPSGLLKGHRLAVEAMWPVYQNLNGIQLEKDVTLYVGWQWSF